MTNDAEPAATQLDLSFELAGRCTVLARRHVGYPFNVTAPLRSATSQAEVIVQSVSGGIYGGERLGQRVSLGAGAQAVVRTPSAAVLHAARNGLAARQCVSLRVAAGATLWYLPRSLILFPGSELVQSMDVTVARHATAMIRDGFLMHDPQAMTPDARSLDSRLTARDAAGHLIAVDLVRVDDGMINAGCPGVTDAFRAFGAVWLIQRMDVARYRMIRAAIARRFAGIEDCYVSTTSLRDDGGAIVRVGAVDGGALDMALDAAVGALQGVLDQRSSLV
jgi:urease accessory protein